ncbi:unnamed protein product [Caenorhabditis sp. 36 PRJEB53466]|nr:unnamed protein product [Caenorhabditis sp. 36 PRJEB53466]
MTDTTSNIENSFDLLEDSKTLSTPQLPEQQELKLNALESECESLRAQLKVHEESTLYTVGFQNGYKQGKRDLAQELNLELEEEKEEEEEEEEEEKKKKKKEEEDEEEEDDGYNLTDDENYQYRHPIEGHLFFFLLFGLIMTFIEIISSRGELPTVVRIFKMVYGGFRECLCPEKVEEIYDDTL